MRPPASARHVVAIATAVLLCTACTAGGTAQPASTGTASSSPAPTSTGAAPGASTVPSSSAAPDVGPPSPAAPSTPAAPPPASPAPGAALATSSVTVTSAQWNSGSQAAEVSAYVPVVEPDGVCTLTLRRGTATVQVRSTAYPDAASTSCDLLVVPRAQVTAGTWQADVTYLSSTTRAASTTLTIEVP